MGRLDGKVVVITGAARNLGRGMARRLARDGASVIVADINDELGEKTANEIRDDLGGLAEFRHANVGVEHEARGLIDSTVSDHGRIDVLINNAQAFSGHHRLERKTNEQLELNLLTGLWAPFWTMQAVFPHMRDNGGGSIVNFTSLAAESGVELLGDYAAAKMAVQGLSATAAREWGRYGIRVNCIAPVAMNPADVGDNVRDPERIRDYARRSPMGRKGNAEEEIAGAAMFLASDDSAFVTGIVVHVDGGIHLTGLPRNVIPD